MKPSCQYSSMVNYNSIPPFGSMNMPTPAVSKEYIIPQFATSGYQTLTALRNGSCPTQSGYFQLDNAYPSCSSRSYVRSACSCESDASKSAPKKPFQPQQRTQTKLV